MFDLKVHIRDAKTGRIEKVQPYKMHVDKEKGTFFERDNKLYYPNGVFYKDIEKKEKGAAK